MRRDLDLDLDLVFDLDLDLDHLDHLDLDLVHLLLLGRHRGGATLTSWRCLSRHLVLDHLCIFFTFVLVIKRPVLDHLDHEGLLYLIIVHDHLCI